MNKADRIRGALYGLIVGDCVGSINEFKHGSAIIPVTAETILTTRNAFGMTYGAFTDDSSMALCMAESLQEKGGFEPYDIMHRFHAWANLGWLSSTGECFDIGVTTSQAIAHYQVDKQTPYCGKADGNTSGNGGVMRLAPIPCFYHADLEAAKLFSVLSSMITHASIECCQYANLLGTMLWQCLNQTSDTQKIAIIEEFIRVYSHNTGSDNALAALLKADIPPTGYVVHTLAIAVRTFYTTDSFMQGLLNITHLGGDADTIGAVYGQLAGAWYGVEAIPAPLIRHLKLLEAIDELVEFLAKRAVAPT